MVGALLFCCSSADQWSAELKQSGLQGTWEVIAVFRDGDPEDTQVGARLRFLDDEVTFYPAGKILEPGS
jgi:hypothetical protein